MISMSQHMRRICRRKTDRLFPSHIRMKIKPKQLMSQVSETNFPAQVQMKSCLIATSPPANKSYWAHFQLRPYFEWIRMELLPFHDALPRETAYHQQVKWWHSQNREWRSQLHVVKPHHTVVWKQGAFKILPLSLGSLFEMRDNRFQIGKLGNLVKPLCAHFKVWDQSRVKNCKAKPIRLAISQTVK